MTGSRWEVGSSSKPNHRQSNKKPVMFSIIVFKDSLRRKKLVIPEFLSNYGHELSEYATLIVPVDCSFQVGLTKKHGNVWFDKGWSDFTDHYSVSYGYFLLFKYEGDSSFCVNIFDTSATEIQYPPSSRSSFVEHDVPAHTNEKKKKKMATNLIGHRDYHRQGLKPSEESNKAIDAANRMTLKNLSFRIILKPSDFHRNAMHIPASFAHKYMVGLDSITAIISDGTDWTMSLRHQGRSLVMSSGCAKFLYENNLSVGDVCVFEMMEEIGNIFKNEIHVQLKNPTNHLLPPSSQGVFIFMSHTISLPSASELVVYRSRENDERHGNMDWDELGFGLTTTDYMYIMTCPSGKSFTQGNVTPYGDISISPSAGVLNYGQGLFEGLKAYRREDGGIMLFRPQENARRMQMGAQRLQMPAPSVDQFVQAVKQTVLANKRWVPPHGKGSLYIRPLLMGSGSVLGIGPAPECTFLIYCSPIGTFYKGGRFLNLYVNNNQHRASRGGTGGIKSITNYAPVFAPVREAHEKGFSDVLFLDAETGKYIEEVSSCNIFIVKGKVISTPAIQGTILPGITRNSIIEIATDMGYQVKERLIPVQKVLRADEVFCTGTAMVVTSVASITYKNRRYEYKMDETTVSNKLRIELTGIQTGLIEDNKRWTLQID